MSDFSYVWREKRRKEQCGVVCVVCAVWYYMLIRFRQYTNTDVITLLLPPSPPSSSTRYDWSGFTGRCDTKVNHLLNGREVKRTI